MFAAHADAPMLAAGRPYRADLLRPGFERGYSRLPDAGYVGLAGDELVRLGDVAAFPYEYAAAGLHGDADAAWWPAWPWPTSTWVALLAGGVLGAGLLWLLTAGQE